VRGGRRGEETALVRQILEYLSYRGVWAYRVNTGGLLDKSGRLVRFGTPGHPDIVARLKPSSPEKGSGRVLWIEAKSAKGRLSPAQKDWQAKAEKYGDVYIVARKIEDVTEYLG